ncbi:MAG: AAA family ATPase [Clostridium sp.]
MFNIFNTQVKQSVEEKTKLVFVVGLAGSGKTKVGKIISQRLKYVYIDKDTVSRPFTDTLLLLNNQSEGDRESRLYLETVRPMEYQISLDIVKENINLGNSTVISAPFLMEAREEEWIQKNIYEKERLGEKSIVKVIWIVSDRETERKRIISRGAKRDEGKLRDWEQYESDVEDFEVLWKDAYKFYNYSNPEVSFNKQIEKVIEWIKK